MICAFCGEDCGIPSSAEDGMKRMANHIVDCEKHPLRNAVVQLEEKDAHIDTLEAWKKRYQLRTGVTIQTAWDRIETLEARYSELTAEAAQMSKAIDKHAGEWVALEARLAKTKAVVDVAKDARASASYHRNDDTFILGQNVFGRLAKALNALEAAESKAAEPGSD